MTCSSLKYLLYHFVVWKIDERTLIVKLDSVVSFMRVHKTGRHRKKPNSCDLEDQKSHYEIIQVAIKMSIFLNKADEQHWFICLKPTQNLQCRNRHINKWSLRLIFFFLRIKKCYCILKALEVSCLGCTWGQSCSLVLEKSLIIFTN